MCQEKMIQAYFKAWLEKDFTPLKTIFSHDVTYSEYYGPEYHGLTQILNWFTDWNAKHTVLEWKIKRFIHQDCTCVAEWYFKAKCNGTIDDFDGVSIIDFDENGKISTLKEFQSKTNHYFPYV